MGLNACINGQCKVYPWNHSSQPATTTANGCVAGDYQDISDDANNWKWKCNGKYWAPSTECSASKQPTPTPPAPKPAPKIEVECSTKQAYVCVKGRLSEKSRREKDEWDKEFSQWYYVWWPRGKYCVRAGWTCTPNTYDPSIDDDPKNKVSCHPLMYGPHCDGWAPQLPPWHYQPWRPGSPKS